LALVLFYNLCHSAVLLGADGLKGRGADLCLNHFFNSRTVRGMNYRMGNYRVGDHWMGDNWVGDQW